MPSTSTNPTLKRRNEKKGQPPKCISCSKLTRIKVTRNCLTTGCVSCHGGIALGGGEFRKFGILRDYWELTGSSEVGKGRFNVTNDPADLYVFKVPGLRNVSMTPPYFHDGSVATLPQAIRLMADLQIGKKLSDQQVHSMVHFLDTLTGKLPAGYAVPPTLPPGGFQAR
jgi:cytochrome c peroxidase